MQDDQLSALVTNFSKIFVATTIACVMTLSSFGQSIKYDLPTLLNGKKLTIYQRNASTMDDGKIKGVKLDENSGEGLAWLNDVTFSTGTIEIDLRGRDIVQKSFIGVAFHGTNDSTFDAVYFRPFNFHAADPIRKIHAVQYVSHPVYTWNKLREEQNGVFEKEIVNAPDPNGWFHARIEVTPENVVVYVNDAKVPSLSVKKISKVSDGKIGLWVGNGSSGDFANLVITRKK